MRSAAFLLWLIFPAVAAAQAPPAFLWLDDFEFCGSPQPYWPDRDGDGFGDDDYSFIGCVQPPDFFPVVPGDCDDLTAAINPNATEVCNGIDDDCDKVVDEGSPGGGASCQTGGAGICATGTTVCTNGALTCAMTTAPQAETCNGLDDDCDGASDEGNPGGGASCDTGGAGICANGTTSCTFGMLVCTMTAAPQPEICNGVDDDCDALVDEDNVCG